MTKPIGEGTGLGLSVIHGIVTNHGGAISVFNRMDEGAAVEVYFPQSFETLESTSSSHRTLHRWDGHILFFINDEFFINEEEPLARLGKE